MTVRIKLGGFADLWSYLCLHDFQEIHDYIMSNVPVCIEPPPLGTVCRSRHLLFTIAPLLLSHFYNQRPAAFEKLLKLFSSAGISSFSLSTKMGTVCPLSLSLLHRQSIQALLINYLPEQWNAKAWRNTPPGCKKVTAIPNIYPPSSRLADTAVMDGNNIFIWAARQFSSSDRKRPRAKPKVEWWGGNLQKKGLI